MSATWIIAANTARSFVHPYAPGSRNYRFASYLGAANSHYLAATAGLMGYSLISGSTSLAKFFSDSCHPR